MQMIIEIPDKQLGNGQWGARLPWMYTWHSHDRVVWQLPLGELVSAHPITLTGQDTAPAAEPV
jgi:hypothetical protein